MRTWHDRPVIAPLVYGLSFFSVGSMSYTAGYLLTNGIRGGIYATLFMYGLLVLYFAESRRVARKERGHE